jgi:N-methylhydantoinase A
MKRLAVDIGGTFTDAVLVDDQTGEVSIDKSPSTPSDFAVGLLNAIHKFKADIPDIHFFAHGTTVCLNAILENKTALTALITTKGFRDVLEIQRSNRTNIYDPMYRKPASLISRPNRYEVSERMSAEGKVLVELDEQELIEVLNVIKQDSVKAIAITFIHSYANNQHETKAKGIVSERLPGIYVVKSTDLTNEWREYERSCTAVLNASLMPIMHKYLESLENKITDFGYQNDIYIMQSNGGVMTSDVAKESPVLTINSGVVGGVIGTQNLSKILGFPNMIGTDMGGTSFDVSLIQSYDYGTRSLMKINTPTSNDDAYPILVPSVDANAIGTGGGSIAWMDVGGGLHVGPKSAGAFPGPACYGAGGAEPTVTDANLVLGRLDATNFLGGSVPLYCEHAIEAIRKISDLIGKGIEETAEGILNVSVTNMANAIRTITIDRGIDPRDFVLVSFGGAGPLHASLISRELNINTVVVPKYPANFCAWGMLAADIKHDSTRTWVATLNDVDMTKINTIYDELEGYARLTLETEGTQASNMVFVREMDIRYLDQGHWLRIKVPSGSLDDSVRYTIAQSFDDAHLKNYLFNDPSKPKQIVSLHLSAYGRIKSHPMAKILQGFEFPPDDAIKNRRQVFINGKWQAFDIYERSKLQAGNRFTGPAIIEEDTSTVLVLAKQKLTVDEYGNMILTWMEA